MQESDAIGREVVEGARVTRWTFGTRTADDDWLHARDRSRGGVDRGETAAIRCRDEGPALHSTQHAINHDGPLRRLRGILPFTGIAAIAVFALHRFSRLPGITPNASFCVDLRSFELSDSQEVRGSIALISTMRFKASGKPKAFCIYACDATFLTGSWRNG